MSIVLSQFPLYCWLVFAPVAQTGEAAPRGTEDVAKALDQQFDKLSIGAKPVTEALAELGQRASVPIKVEEESLDLLPWGKETKFSEVTIEKATLREALTLMLARLGMSYVERDGVVWVSATAPLKRMNRRATWEDLKLLSELMETEFSPETFAKFRLQFRITSQLDPPKLLNDQFAKAGRGTIAQILEVATGSLGWTWFPNKDHVVVLSNQAAINHRLSRRISARYNNVPLSKILIDLCTKADVALEMQPGMMLKLPPNIAQSYTLSLLNSSVKEALEEVAANTGVKYEVTRELIRFSLSDEASGDAAAAQARRGSNYVGKITVPSKDGSFSFEILVRENELPKDILEYRQQIIESTVEKLKAEMSPDSSIKPPARSGNGG